MIRVLSAASLSLGLLNLPRIPDGLCADDRPARTPEKGLDQNTIEASKIVLRATVTHIRDRIKAGKMVKEEAVVGTWVAAAASAARGLDAPEPVQRKAFLIALGLSFENSNLVRSVMGPELKMVEGDADRDARLEVLKDPTYGKKARLRTGASPDKTSHFAASAMLTAIHGADAAEAMGIQKESIDLLRGSGFDMSDIAANLAGIRLAQRVLKGELTLDRLSVPFDAKKGTGFRGSEYFPEVLGFTDTRPLSTADFRAKYGSPGDKRFTDDIARLKEALGKANSP